MTERLEIHRSGICWSAFRNGGVAQLGERLLCKQEVIGSIPFTSTTKRGGRDQESGIGSGMADSWSLITEAVWIFNNLAEVKCSDSRDGVEHGL